MTQGAERPGQRHAVSLLDFNSQCLQQESLNPNPQPQQMPEHAKSLVWASQAKLPPLSPWQDSAPMSEARAAWRGWGGLRKSAFAISYSKVLMSCVFSIPHRKLRVLLGEDVARCGTRSSEHRSLSSLHPSSWD